MAINRTRRFSVTSPPRRSPRCCAAPDLSMPMCILGARRDWPSSYNRLLPLPRACSRSRIGHGQQTQTKEFDVKRVFVTGGNGFIGQYVVRDLVARGIEVVSYVLIDPAERLEGVKYVRGTI